MPTAWQVLILVLPGLLLLTLEGNSANPVNPSYPEVTSTSDHTLKDESALTRFEEAELSGDGAPTSVQELEKKKQQEDDHNIQQRNLPSSTSRKSFFTKGPVQTTWGSHPIGTRDSFVLNDHDQGLRWIAYFYDQAVATVLQTENGTIQKCTVQENIQEWEQKAALRYLGEIMPLQPIPFNAMVHLITICGTLNIPPPPQQNSIMPGTSHLWWLDVSTLQGILPGTMWCGMQDRATFYHQLGTKQKVDSCCRAHDHCPIKLSSLTMRYGVTNLGFKTLSHCSCDLEFYRCLKAAGSDTAALVGQMYFNYLDMQCLNASPQAQAESNPVNVSRPIPRDKRNHKDSGRLECVRVDTEGGCRKWVLRPKNFSPELVVTSLEIRF